MHEFLIVVAAVAVGNLAPRLALAIGRKVIIQRLAAYERAVMGRAAADPDKDPLFQLLFGDAAAARIAEEEAAQAEAAQAGE